MKKQKITALLLAAVLAASALGGCASKTATNTTEADTSKTDTSVTDTSTTDTSTTDVSEADDTAYEGKHIEIMYNTDDTWTDIVDNYAKDAVAEAFPGLDVEFVPIADVGYETLASVGDLPDIFFGTVSDALVEAEAVMDLHPYLKDWLADNFKNPDFYNDSQGRTWAVGSGTDTFYTSVYYYNKDVFAELNLSAPQSFEEFKNVCQTLVDAGYEVPLSHSYWSISLFWLEQAIVSYDPEAYADLMANKTDFNDPRIRAAVANIQEIMDMGALGKGVAEKDLTASISEFVEGNAPILATMCWNSGAVAGNTSFDVGVFYFPTANENVANGTAYTCWGSFLNGWAVNAKTEDPELTVEVLKVLVDAEAHRNFDNGLITNYVVEGNVQFANDLDAERYELFKKVESWGTAFYPNALDSNALSEYYDVLTEWLADDSTMDADGFCDAMQTVWENNTFFEKF